MFLRKFQALSGKSEFFFFSCFTRGVREGKERRAAARSASRGSAFPKKMQRFFRKGAGLFRDRCRAFFAEGLRKWRRRGGEGSSGFPGGGVEDGLLCAFVVDLGRLVEEISVCRECFWRKRASGVIFVLPEEAVGSAGGNH